MAKTVTIPAGDNPFICKINDVYYSYPAGTTVEVPDEVAALIQANAGNREKSNGLSDIAIPRDGEVDDVLTRTADGAKWATPAAELPAVSATDNGDVLTVVEGAWAKAAPSGDGMLVIHADDATMTLDKTWSEVNAADVAAILIDVEGSRSKLFVEETWSSVDDGYGLNASIGGNVLQFTTDSADGYPVLES